MRLAVVACLLVACSTFAVRAADPAECKLITPGQTASLKANASTVHWGYVYSGLTPNLIVSSGDTVEMELITHHAGDDTDKMIKGDPGMEDIYKWTKDGQNVDMRGAKGGGEGVHILTGPVYVCGAEPGDVLQIDILELKPRINPSTGKTYGSNAAANWGYQFRAGFLDGDPREVITIYEVVEEDGQIYAVPDYQFRYAGGPTGYPGPTTPCTTTSGTVPELLPGMNMTWADSTSTYSGRVINCTNDEMTWGGYYYPGLLTTHPTGTEDYSIRGKFKVPANFHIGNIGLAPKSDVTVTSVPPLVTGGNMDNRRVGAGSTLFLPVEVAGAYLSAGDSHTAQGDSELDGTGIETSTTATMKLTLHKAGSLPSVVANLKGPLIETADSWVIQGYTYADYLNELKDPQNTIYSKSSLDPAMTVAYNHTRDWMMSVLNMTENEAITAITVATDFAVTQVVDGNWGIHCVIPKKPFGLPTVGAKSAVTENLSTAPESAPGAAPEAAPEAAPGAAPTAAPPSASASIRVSAAAALLSILAMALA